MEDIVAFHPFLDRCGRHVFPECQRLRQHAEPSIALVVPLDAAGSVVSCFDFFSELYGR